MHERLTIQDIARLAGVSKATVSRVLNHHPSVSPAIYERVRRVIDEHGFVPNATATGLAGGKTHLIGVLTPPLTWPAIPEMLRGIAEYIEDTPYEMVLYSIRFERNHSEVLDRILSMRMACGLVAILPGELFPRLIKRFHEGLPLVLIDDQKKPAAIPRVSIDNRAGAYQATRYLLELGHRRIALIQGPQEYYCVMQRTQGYMQALQEAGVAIDRALFLQGRFDVPSGRECAKALFSSERSSWPDAIFASNDQMAYGVLDVAEQMGIRIPEDISLVGFDDNILSARVHPPLTTIRQPFFEMGCKAVELLLAQVDPEQRAQLAPAQQDGSSADALSLHTDTSETPAHAQLPTTLMIRHSSAPHKVNASNASAK
jgi:LacI family transcriptional regulator